MKMTKRPDIHLLYNETKVMLYIDNKDRAYIVDYLCDLDFDIESEYDIVIQKRRKKKTKDQNAYAWELMGQLASKLKISTKDVYRQIQEGMSKFEIVPIRKDAVKSFIKAWSNGHDGRICEDLGVTKNYPNYHNIKAHYGISDYSKEEMSHFIELVIQECHEQGIPTITPAEIARLEWAG